MPDARRSRLRPHVYFWKPRLALGVFSYALWLAAAIPIRIFWGWPGLVSFVIGSCYQVAATPIDNMRSDRRREARALKRVERSLK